MFNIPASNVVPYYFYDKSNNYDFMYFTFCRDHCVSPVLGSSLPIYPEIDKSNETNVFSCHLVYFLLPDMACVRINLGMTI